MENNVQNCGCSGSGAAETCKCGESFRAMPMLGEDAPAFKAQTTQGEINFPEDFKGRWVILFSHPADFTPVCTTEFIKFAAMDDELRGLNCQLIGLSIDGLSSHIAWLRTIGSEVEFDGIKNISVKFPLIDDVSMEVARKYGMLHPKMSGTKSVRTVFFIDPQGKVRTILYYPLSTGRNMDEIKRILIALQTADACACATPADWRPGDDVIDPNPGTMDKIEERLKKGDAGLVVKSWFLVLRKLPLEKLKNVVKGIK